MRTIRRWLTVLVNRQLCRVWRLGILSMIILTMMFYQHAISISHDQRRDTDNSMDREREHGRMPKETDNSMDREREHGRMPKETDNSMDREREHGRMPKETDNSMDREREHGRMPKETDNSLDREREHGRKPKETDNSMDREREHGRMPKEMDNSMDREREHGRMPKETDNSMDREREHGRMPKEMDNSMDREREHGRKPKEMDIIKLPILQPKESKLVGHTNPNLKWAAHQMINNETEVPKREYISKHGGPTNPNEHFSDHEIDNRRIETANGAGIVTLPLMQPKETKHGGSTKLNRQFSDHQAIDDKRAEITKGKDIIKLPLAQPKENKPKKESKHVQMGEHRMIDILCDMYRRQVTTGNMCHQLCNSKTLGNSIEQRDYGDMSGKRVFMLNCTSCLPDRRITSVVMKLFWEPDWENDTNAEIREHKTVNSYEEYLNAKLNEYATMYYGRVLTSAEKTLSVIWGEQLNREASENARLTVLRSISGLIEQDSNEEYLSLRFFQKLSFIPSMYGTCGPAYFSERVPTLVDLGYARGFSSKDNIVRIPSPALSWKRAAEISLKLLQLIKDMDNAFEQGLTMCDFKAMHFGFTNDDQVVITDLDDLRYPGDFRSFLSRRALQRGCSSSSQCSEWACNRECNLKTHTCELVWTNNNLQRMCSIVFTKSNIKNIIPPSQSAAKQRLRENISHCTSLSFSNMTQLRVASEKVFDKFKEIFTELLTPS